MAASRRLHATDAILILFVIFATACLNWKLHKKQMQTRWPAEGWNDSPALPIPQSLPIYNKELASHAIRTTTWMCGDKNPPADQNQRPFFAFVHVYKTAGTSLRHFFADYADLCRKSMMLIVNCSGIKASILKSKASENWNSCRLKYVIDRHGNQEGEHDGVEDRVYPTINNTVLQEHFDILAGHYRFGLSDNVFPHHQPPSSNPLDTTPVRHIVFLRQPMERYVSSKLYRAKQFGTNKKEMSTVEDTVDYIKKRVRERRKKNEYLDSIFNYLLTPEQAQTTMRKLSTEQLMEHKTQLAIKNLVHYNAIVGMTERFSESMAILQHALLPSQFSSDERKDSVGEMFENYSADGDSSQSSRQNPSQMGTISTSSVTAELKKDDAFIQEFQEYLKYEQIIVDFALKMHNMQYDLVINAKLRKTNE